MSEPLVDQYGVPRARLIEVIVAEYMDRKSAEPVALTDLIPLAKEAKRAAVSVYPYPKRPKAPKLPTDPSVEATSEDNDGSEDV